MEARVWTSGSQANSRRGFGIYVGAPNRAEHFDRGWSEIEVEIDGAFHRFSLTPGFWRRCPEFRDSGEPVIRRWLERQGLLSWPNGIRPIVELTPLGGNRFRLAGARS